MFTYRQNIILQKVQEHINSLRCMLDDIMYGQDHEKLTDNEFNRIRNAYNDICKAADDL